jgi:PD-(D/E)XK endonuclease
MVEDEDQSQNQNQKQDQNQDQDQRQRTGASALHTIIPWIFAVAEDAGSEEGWWEKRRRNPKRLGEMAQAAFLLKAQSLGFGLAVPWGDSEKWDFVVWAGPGGRLLRVQVKATGRLNGGGYDVQPVYTTRDGSKRWYTKDDIDVMAAHVSMEGGGEAWYLLPVGVVAGVKSLRLFPGMTGKNPRWEEYREAWKWLGLER